MKKTLFVFIVATLFITACKKNEPDEPAPATIVLKTTAEKVLGKWMFNSLVLNEFYSNTLYSDTVIGTAFEYLEFRNNGKMYANINFLGGMDTLSYAVMNDSTINIDGEINKIKELTESKFVIYDKIINSTSPLEYEEFFLNLKK